MELGNLWVRSMEEMAGLDHPQKKGSKQTGG